MNCPACKQSDLQERTLKNRLVIDNCQSCRGIWLDGGELQRLTKDPSAANRAIKVLLSDAVPTDRDCHDVMCRWSQLNSPTPRLTSTTVKIVVAFGSMRENSRKSSSSFNRRACRRTKWVVTSNVPVAVLNARHRLLCVLTVATTFVQAEFDKPKACGS